MSQESESPALHPEREALELVPESMAQVYKIMPLALRGNVLIVAASAPNDNLEGDLTSMLHLDSMEVVPATRDQVQKAITKYYDDPDEGEEPPDTLPWEYGDEE